MLVTKTRITSQYYDETLAEGVLPLRMHWIPAGQFVMGSPPDELERQEREGPQRVVNVSQFFMAQYPVTQAQWRFVAELPQQGQKLALNPSRFKREKRPVELVNWYEAVEFCARLTTYTDRIYRLPSEAEWEYACRAVTNFQSSVNSEQSSVSDEVLIQEWNKQFCEPFHTGVTISTDYANYNGSHEEYGVYWPGKRGVRRGETNPVDEFRVTNAFGLSDMHGNVWEWCMDHWHDSYKGVPRDGSAWIEGGDGNLRILRGGSWDSLPRRSRSAYRGNGKPDDRTDSFGFRVVCSSLKSVSSEQ